MLPISARFQDALTYAASLHAEQVRKGRGVPYLAHLLSVAALAMEHGADEDEAIAALLHDAVEDQGGQPTLDAIRGRFGSRVAEIVEGCSDALGEPKPPWEERKQRYIANLKNANASVRLVSACDKLHNARSILSDMLSEGEQVFDLFKGGKKGTLWYYRALADVYRETGDARLARLAVELDRVVGEIERLAST